MIKGGHLLRPIGSRRTPLWARLVCGVCGIGFEANAHSVPQIDGRPFCRGCCRRLNLLRRQANMPEWDLPEDAYPDADPDQVRDVIPQVPVYRGFRRPEQGKPE